MITSEQFTQLSKDIREMGDEYISDLQMEDYFVQYDDSPKDAMSQMVGKIIPFVIEKADAGIAEEIRDMANDLIVDIEYEGYFKKNTDDPIQAMQMMLECCVDTIAIKAVLDI